MLAGPGLGDDPGLAEPAGEEDLPEGVVDLVGAGVAEVLALEPEVEADGLFVLGAADVAFPTFLPYLPLFLQIMVDEPALAERYLEATTEGVMSLLRPQLEMGVDGILGAEDWCFGKAPLMSPEMFRRFLAPHLRRIAEECHRRGVPFIKHLDGNTTVLLDILVDEVGIDGLNGPSDVTIIADGSLPARWTALDLLSRYEKAGVKLFVNDFSLDTGIPSIGVLAYDPSTFPSRSEIVWTAGTTPGPDKALIRALTEVAQLAGDFNTNGNYVASGLPKFTTLEEAEFVLRPGKEIPIQSLPDLSNDNIRVEVENCVSALARAGLSVLAVDVTHPGLQIPSFYTIIPGAHFRERSAGTSLGLFSAKLIAESGNPLWAISELEKMDRLLPGKYYVQFYLGTCHLALEEPGKALRFFERALALGPKDQDIPSLYSYLGVCLKDLGQYREALAALHKAEALDRERTDVYNLMGFCYFKLKEHEKAIDCFRRVLELNPASAIDYANIGSNYRDMGDRDQAIRYYTLALELDPTIHFARENLERLQSDK